MYLPAAEDQLTEGCELLLMIILIFTLIHGYWNHGNRRTTPFALLALLLFVLPLLFTFQKFVVLDRFAPRSQKLFADNPLQITACGLMLFQAAIPFPVRFSQSGQYTDFLIDHARPFVHDVL